MGLSDWRVSSLHLSPLVVPRQSTHHFDPLGQLNDNITGISKDTIVDIVSSAKKSTMAAPKTVWWVEWVG